MPVDQQLIDELEQEAVLLSKYRHLTNAEVDVVNERDRQTKVLGWTAEKDNRWSNHELSTAAIAYILADDGWWPWQDNLPDLEILSSNGYRRRLVKAAALLIAEIERVDRLYE